MPKNGVKATLQIPSFVLNNIFSLRTFKGHKSLDFVLNKLDPTREFELYAVTLT